MATLSQAESTLSEGAETTGGVLVPLITSQSARHPNRSVMLRMMI